jgi:hypothetical protein
METQLFTAESVCAPLKTFIQPELAKALAAFNKETISIEKDANNPFHKSKYATLDGIIATVKPLLAKHGLSVLQFASGDGEHVGIQTILLHESGESLESPVLLLKPAKNDPQGIGSAVTYGKRYSYVATLSLPIGIDADDDGNAASGIQSSQTKPSGNGRPATQPNNKPRVVGITGEQQSKVKELAQGIASISLGENASADAIKTEMGAIFKKHGITAQTTTEQAAKVIEALKEEQKAALESRKIYS